MAVPLTVGSLGNGAKRVICMCVCMVPIVMRVGVFVLQRFVVMRMAV